MWTRWGAEAEAGNDVDHLYQYLECTTDGSSKWWEIAVRDWGEAATNTFLVETYWNKIGLPRHENRHWTEICRSLRVAKDLAGHKIREKLDKGYRVGVTMGALPGPAPFSGELLLEDHPVQLRAEKTPQYGPCEYVVWQNGMEVYRSLDAYAAKGVYAARIAAARLAGAQQAPPPEPAGCDEAYVQELLEVEPGPDPIQTLVDSWEV